MKQQSIISYKRNKHTSKPPASALGSLTRFRAAIPCCRRLLPLINPQLQLGALSVGLFRTASAVFEEYLVSSVQEKPLKRLMHAPAHCPQLKLGVNESASLYK